MIMLPRSVWEAMKAYCQSLLPEEACGLLAGFPENSGTGASRLTVTEFVPVPNISSHRLHEFEMSAQALTEHLFHIQKNSKKIAHRLCPLAPNDTGRTLFQRRKHIMETNRGHYPFIRGTGQSRDPCLYLDEKKEQPPNCRSSLFQFA